MEYRIKTSKAFDREIKRLSKRYHSMADDYERLLNEIEGTVVVSVAEAEINLLYIYDKAERSSISKKEIAQLIAENL